MWWGGLGGGQTDFCCPSWLLWPTVEDRMGGRRCWPRVICSHVCLWGGGGVKAPIDTSIWPVTWICSLRVPQTSSGALRPGVCLGLGHLCVLHQFLNTLLRGEKQEAWDNHGRVGRGDRYSRSQYPRVWGRDRHQHHLEKQKGRPEQEDWEMACWVGLVFSEQKAQGRAGGQLRALPGPDPGWLP